MVVAYDECFYVVSERNLRITDILQMSAVKELRALEVQA